MPSISRSETLISRMRASILSENGMNQPAVLSLRRQKSMFSNKKSVNNLISGVVLLFLPFALSAAPLNDLPTLVEYKAHYQLRWHGLPIGTTDHKLQKLSQNTYLATASAKPFLPFIPFKAFEKSEFFLQQQQIYPLQYNYQIEEKGKKKEGQISFQWSEKKAQSKKGGILFQEFDLRGKAHDKITFYLQLRQDLQNQKQPLRYTVIEPTRIKIYTFSIRGSERLHTPIGTLETFLVEHHSEDQQRATKLWLAKDFHYIVVKAQQIRRGRLNAESIIQRLEIPK